MDLLDDMPLPRSCCVFRPPSRMRIADRADDARGADIDATRSIGIVRATGRGCDACSGRGVARRLTVIFFYPFMPTLPFLTAREHVGKYDVLTPGYTLASQYQEACLSAVRRADWVVLDTRWTDPDFLRRMFPVIQNAHPHETAAFEEVMDNAFSFVARYGVFELRHQRRNISESLCANVSG